MTGVVFHDRVLGFWRLLALTKAHRTRWPKQVIYPQSVLVPRQNLGLPVPHCCCSTQIACFHLASTMVRFHIADTAAIHKALYMQSISKQPGPPILLQPRGSAHCALLNLPSLLPSKIRARLRTLHRPPHKPWKKKDWTRCQSIMATWSRDWLRCTKTTFTPLVL